MLLYIQFSIFVQTFLFNKKYCITVIICHETNLEMFLQELPMHFKHQTMKIFLAKPSSHYNQTSESTFPTLIKFPLSTYQKYIETNAHAVSKASTSASWAYFQMVFRARGIKYTSNAYSPHYTFSPQWPHSQWGTWGWHVGKATDGFKFQEGGQMGVKRFTPFHSRML